MNREKLAKLLPAIFLLIAVVLLSPILTGKTLVPSDSLKSIPLSIFGESELFEHKHIVQWIPYLFGGMPCYSSIMVTPSYFISAVFVWILGSISIFFRDPLAQHIVHLFILGWGSVLYLKLMGISKKAAYVTALNLVLMTTLTGLIGAGHTIKFWTVCWMPLAMYFLEKNLRKPSLRDFASASLVLGIMLSVKHIQMSWYYLILIGIYALIRLYQIHKEDTSKLILPVVSAGGILVMGLMLVSFLYLPVLDYTEMSMRASTESSISGGDYSAAYSYPPNDVLSWIIPGAKGFGGQNYWGSLEYTAFPLYMGVLWFPFLILAFAFKEDRKIIISWLAPAFLLFLLGIGKYSPIYELTVNYLPFYAKFRAHMWAIAPVQMLLVFSSGFGLNAIFERKFKKDSPLELQKKLPQITLITGVAFFAIAAVFAGNVPDQQNPVKDGDSFFSKQDEQRIVYYFQQQGQKINIQQFNMVKNQVRTGRAEIFYKDSARTMAILGVIAILVALILMGKLRKDYAVYAFALLLMFDLIPIDRRTMRFEARKSPEALFRPQGNMAYLASLTDKESFRIWTKDAYNHNEAAYFKLHSIDGYHGAKLATIQKVLSAGKSKAAAIHQNFLDILNVKYVLSNNPLPGLQVLNQDADGYLQQNPGHLPRISFPEKWVEMDAEHSFAAIMENSFNAKTLGILEKQPLDFPTNRTGEAIGEIVSYEPQRIEYTISNKSPALALLSEIWTPEGWHAYLDGVEIPIIRADYLLRGVAITEPGEHQLVMEYSPKAWTYGVWISLISLLSIIAMYVVGKRKDA
jgi:hypothetical protein